MFHHRRAILFFNAFCDEAKIMKMVEIDLNMGGTQVVFASL